MGLCLNCRSLGQTTMVGIPNGTLMVDDEKPEIICRGLFFKEHECVNHPEQIDEGTKCDRCGWKRGKQKTQCKHFTDPYLHAFIKAEKMNYCPSCGVKLK